MAMKERSVLVAVITTAGVVIAALITAGYFKPSPATQPQAATATTLSVPVDDRAATDSSERVDAGQKVDRRVRQLPRVVMHVASDDPRTLVNQIRRKLLDAGYDVPAIVAVTPNTTPSVVEVRYFRDAERAKGDFVVDELRKSGIDARLSNRSELGSNAPLNQVEIWFPRRPVR
jgi:ribosomal protein L13E